MTRKIIRLEKCSHRLLAPLPQNLIETQQSTVQLRQRYRQFSKQLILLQSLLQSFQVVRGIWRRQQKKRQFS